MSLTTIAEAYRKGYSTGKKETAISILGEDANPDLKNQVARELDGSNRLSLSESTAFNIGQMVGGHTGSILKREYFATDEKYKERARGVRAMVEEIEAHPRGLTRVH